MGKLLHRDTLFRLAANVRERPEQWLSRLIFLLGPWVSFWMVEILNGNDVFSDLYSWQVLMNLIWYYLLFLLCRLILGRRRRAAATAAGLFCGDRKPLCAPLSGPDPVSGGSDRLGDSGQCGGRL